MRIIAGPCQHENILESFEIASHCRRVCEDLGFEYFFKASFDKANRSSINSYRGPGLNKGLNILEKITYNKQIPSNQNLRIPIKTIIIGSIKLDMLSTAVSNSSS